MRAEVRTDEPACQGRICASPRPELESSGSAYGRGSHRPESGPTTPRNTGQRRAPVSTIPTGRRACTQVASTPDTGLRICEVAPCHPRARTGRKPETWTGTRTTTKLALNSIAAVEFRPGIDMVRRRSTVRFRPTVQLTCSIEWFPVATRRRSRACTSMTASWLNADISAGQNAFSLVSTWSR
jgi:hypothetical protein